MGISGKRNQPNIMNNGYRKNVYQEKEKLGKRVICKYAKWKKETLAGVETWKNKICKKGFLEKRKLEIGKRKINRVDFQKFQPF